MVGEKKATGAGVGWREPSKQWMDSGPSTLASSKACSASRRTTTGERPWLEAMPKQAERRMDWSEMRKGELKTSWRRRSASMMALMALQPGRAMRNSSLPGRPKRS